LKYLAVLILFAAVAFYAYWRLRPYIRGARRLLGALREVNRMRGGEVPTDLSKKAKGEEVEAEGGPQRKAPALRRLRHVDARLPRRLPQRRRDLLLPRLPRTRRRRAALRTQVSIIRQ
jgi:hypothetical protein